MDLGLLHLIEHVHFLWPWFVHVFFGSFDRQCLLQFPVDGSAVLSGSELKNHSLNRVSKSQFQMQTFEPKSVQVYGPNRPAFAGRFG